MITCVLLTRLSTDAFTGGETIEQLNERVQERVRQSCPEIRWLSNFAVTGPYDYLDVFEAPSAEVATKVSFIIRSIGHATTETWIATPWDRFVPMAKAVQEGARTGAAGRKQGAAESHNATAR
jgi:uncharacterized protein with GYD domain